MPTILTWRLGALGDTLLLLPALAALRAAFPTHTLVVAGNPAALAPARWHGLVDRVLDAGSAALAPLSAGDPPVPGVLPPEIDVAIVWSARGAAIARGLGRAGTRRVLVAPAVPVDQTPVAEHYLATLAPLGVRAVPFALHAPLEAKAATARAWQAATGRGASPAPAGTPIVLLHPGAGAPAKRWPLARYRELARQLRGDGARVVWTAGPADEEIRVQVEDGDEQGDVLPLVDLAGLAAVVERAAVVVSGDCGVAHLTALLGVRGVALFGPTNARVWGPPSERATVVRLALPCAPCDAGAPHCPSRICLRGLPVATVRAATRAGIERWRDERSKDEETAGFSRAGRVPHPSPSRPADYRPPAPVPGPPGALRLAVWGSPDRWELWSSTEPG